MPETTKDPESIARAVALEVAEEPDHVGDFVQAIDLGDNVTDFRFTSLLRGYEGWQWSVTLYHDVELDEWTVNESSLTPTDQALRPPAWIPWKDRLLPTDLSVTDSIGTEPDDPRLEAGFQENADSVSQHNAEPDAAADDTSASTATDDSASNDSANADSAVSADDDAQSSATASSDSAAAADNTVSSDNTVPSDSAAQSAENDTQPADGETAEQDAAEPVSSPEDIDDAVSAFDLSRRHVLTPLGRAQTAKRWYEGPRGPKSLSTKTAAGNLCSTCGFCVPIQGELGVMFGVCANKWSPDDGRVVSLDHGCGEHSEIDPPEPSHLWIQSKPAFDDLHIDVIAQTPREEHDEVDLIEQLRNTNAEQAADDDASETDVSTEATELVEEPSDAEAVEDSSEQTAEEEAAEETVEEVTEEEASEAVSFESQDQDMHPEVPAEQAADMESADAQAELVSDAAAEESTEVAESAIEDPVTEEPATEESSTEEPVEEPASVEDSDTAEEEDNNAELNAE